MFSLPEPLPEIAWYLAVRDFDAAFWCFLVARPGTHDRAEVFLEIRRSCTVRHIAEAVYARHKIALTEGHDHRVGEGAGRVPPPSAIATSRPPAAVRRADLMDHLPVPFDTMLARPVIGDQNVMRSDSWTLEQHPSLGCQSCYSEIQRPRQSCVLRIKYII